MNVNWTSGGSPAGEPPYSELLRLKKAVTSGDYRVPAEEVASALLRWHTDFASGIAPHEAAPLGVGA